jgi:carboxyl-terminal processing protease
MRLAILYLPVLLSCFSTGVYSHPAGRSGHAGEAGGWDNHLARALRDTGKLSCRQNGDQLLDEALNFMQKNYYRKDAVDWDGFILAARARLNGSSNCEDAYGTIGWCFSQLNESHSFLMPPAKALQYNYDTASLSSTPALADLVGEIKGELLPDSIGYLTIPWVSTTDSIICMHIADSIQDLIARLDVKGISRWIVDLRKNTGGNCWPMLAGVGPLLGNGVCGYFVSEDERVPIVYRDGAAFQGRHVRCRLSTGGYQTRRSHKSIVVLTGRRTVSAGEILALAFKGKEGAWLYGEPTAGLTTANATYSLSDHSMLVLTVCREADYAGRICEGSVNPDKFIGPHYGAMTEGPGSPVEDGVKLAAISWLRGQ